MITFKAKLDPRNGSPWRGPDPVPNSPEWARPVSLLDLETNSYRIVVRLLWRRWPFYFALVPFFLGHRGTVVLKLGRRPGR